MYAKSNFIINTILWIKIKKMAYLIEILEVFPLFDTHRMRMTIFYFLFNDP